ncbi:hypothetical protein T06_12521 [Trichinella sp. T6]|nr:hypothetical protein T06_12521 [Trichinella sp. T6]
MREEVGGVVGECQSSEYRDEIDVGGGEVGEEAVSVRYETNRLAGRMKCVIVTANAPRQSLLGKQVQNKEAMEGKCTCGGYWKIVSANQVDYIVGYTRESEAWQKIIGHLLVLKPAEKARKHKQY